MTDAKKTQCTRTATKGSPQARAVHSKCLVPTLNSRFSHHPLSRTHLAGIVRTSLLHPRNVGTICVSPSVISGCETLGAAGNRTRILPRFQVRRLFLTSQSIFVSSFADLWVTFGKCASTVAGWVVGDVGASQCHGKCGVQCALFVEWRALLCVFFFLLRAELRSVQSDNY